MRVTLMSHWHSPGGGTCNKRTIHFLHFFDTRLPSDLRHGKTRMAGLPDGEKFFTTVSAVLTQYRTVTDTYTDTG